MEFDFLNVDCMREALSLRVTSPSSLVSSILSCSLWELREVFRSSLAWADGLDLAMAGMSCRNRCTSHSVDPHPAARPLVDACASNTLDQVSALQAKISGVARDVFQRCLYCTSFAGDF